MRRKLIPRAFGVLALTFLACALGLAQGTTSRVTGVVTDNAGAAVGGATVTLTDEGTNTSATTQTSDSGAYTFDLIQPGKYTITVEKQGFKKFISSGNAALINQPTTVNARMEIGDVSATVNVENTAEVVQTSSSGNIGSTVEQRTLESLPIVGTRGRNPLDILNYEPGVVTGANTGGGVSVNGSRDRAFNFTLDGIDINEATAGGSNFTPLRPNPDSVQEFQIVTSGFTAELGRSSGAQVTFVTRSGTNHFHGNVFEYYQTPRFHARSYAANVTGAGKEQFVQNIYGGSFGGPLFNFGVGEDTKYHFLRDRAFFFVNLQVLRAYDSAVSTRTVLTQTARQGIFRFVRNASGNNAGVVDASGNPLLPNCPAAPGQPCVDTFDIQAHSGLTLDPLLMGYLNAMPLPNNFSATGDGLNTSGFVFSSPEHEKQYDFVTKLDFKLNEKNNLYVRYAQGEQNTFGDAANGGRPRFPGVPDLVDTFRTPKNVAVNWRWSPTPTFTNEFLVGWSQFGFSFLTPEPDPNYTFVFNLPTDINTNFSYNARSFRTWQIIDNATFALSNHVIKAGVNFRLGRGTDDRASVFGTNIEPTVDFSRTVNPIPSAWGTSVVSNSSDRTRLENMINDELGRVGNYSRAFVSDPTNPDSFAPAGTRWIFDASYPELDFYAQDTWRMKPNFIVDLGARLEAKLEPDSAGGRPRLVSDKSVTWGSAPSNSISWVEGDLFKNEYLLMPSLGFAWDPFKNGKTSIRANYRLASDRIGTFLYSSFIWQNTPGNTFSGSANAFGLLRQGLPDVSPTRTPDSLRTPNAFGTGSINVIDPDLQAPKIHNWTVSFQREIWKDNVFEFDYIGKKATNLWGGYNSNQVRLDGTLPGVSGTFLDAFNRVRAGSTNDPFINLLLTGNSGNAGGTTRFIALNSTAISQGSVATLALAASQKTCVNADVTAGLCTSGQLGQRILALRGLDSFFQPFSQFTGGLFVIDSNDYSFYNGLDFIFRRRIRNGLGFQIGYTWALSKDSRSFDPVFTTIGTGTSQTAANTPFDNSDRRLNYSWSDFDRRHTILGTYVWELPFGKGKWLGSDSPTVMNYAISGWQVAGGVRWMSGRPFTVYSGLTTFSQSVGSTANCDGCTRDMGSLEQLDLDAPGRGLRNWWFDAQDRASFSQPAPGQQGNTPRNFFIGPAFFETDISLLRKFRINERLSFDLRVEAKNLTNTPNFDQPSAVFPANGVLTGNIFGRINASVVNNARRVQFSGKLNF
jgi:hypothetical protein